MNQFIEFVSALVPPLLRSIGGWAANSFADGTLDKFELQKLGETFIRVLVLTAGTYFGLNGLGLDIDAFSAGMTALVFDFFLSNKKKK